MADDMENPRRYGEPPFSVAVIHGGPGAPGGMAPVARELSIDRGVLEPLQTARSLEGQIDELRLILTTNGDPPFTLIGSSWGAMLSYMLAARCPEIVKKLILVGSGVYEEQYAASIQDTRLSRLTEQEREEVRSLMEVLDDPANLRQDTTFTRLGVLFTKTDAYNPLTLDTELIKPKYDVYQNVWKDVVELRSSGKLLEMGKMIRCPVVAIHGDYDPHPAIGIERPLTAVVKDFRFILLRNCGHLPWVEKEAKDRFYAILRQELS